VKKFSYLLVLCTLILSGCKKDDPVRDIVDIPDNGFRNALINSGVDTNGDRIISTAEAEAVTNLDVSTFFNISTDIYNMKGIEAFVNLVTLNCSWNQLTSLDVSNCTVLTMLYCWHNQLTSLNVSGCTELNELHCAGNQLTSLDVSNNTAITKLDCAYNQLTNLDVSNNIALTELHCYYNQLTSLNISGCTALNVLHCSDNQLTSLDVSNNTSLSSLAIMHMPSLNMVCVWIIPFPPAGVAVDTTNSPNVYFTTDCSK